ncbi:hypothetical protein QLH51_04485 [Sphingomonas sp. 2R-10]|nr:hypothetical protein [Sphingomonas sp. 2R-10]MDJ0276061.1 hypothetical protein [Sphingomonas sp. 2R-10]
MTSIGGIAKGCQALLSGFPIGNSDEDGLRIPIESEYWHGL